jgi:hypothetical protein
VVICRSNTTDLGEGVARVKGETYVTAVTVCKSPTLGA